MARLGGEVSAETLEAYRRAGAGVYDLLALAEARRSELAGADSEVVDDATRCLLLCTWNAFALQTVGDAFLDADYAANRRTVGFVPPITKEQAMRFYGEVEAWMRRSQAAHASGHDALDVAVPAELPAFAEVDPCPVEHLQAMLSATGALREHAETATLDAERLPGASPDQMAELRALLASAANAADYARGLYGGGRAGQEVHERVEASLQEALGLFYLAGQLAAMPDLVGRQPLPASVTGAGARLPGPGEPGFDPWVLTDPRSRDAWGRDPKARAAIDALWKFDPDARATLDLQAEVGEAMRRGYVVYATDRDGRRRGHYYCCPWPPIYATSRPVMIGGRRLRAGEEFTLEVSAEECTEGGPFKRELLVTSFGPTDRVDYCDPRDGGHDD